MRSTQRQATTYAKRCIVIGLHSSAGCGNSRRIEGGTRTPRTTETGDTAVTYYVFRARKGWGLSLSPKGAPMPGGIFKSRKAALTTARLLAGWNGAVEEC